MATVGGVVSVKLGVTVVAALMVTLQAPVPETPPPRQRIKVEPAAGVAVSVTTVPLAKPAEQVAPQLIPAGLLVTVPEPVPASVTVSAKVGVGAIGVAMSTWICAWVSATLYRRTSSTVAGKNRFTPPRPCPPIRSVLMPLRNGLVSIAAEIGRASGRERG